MSDAEIRRLERRWHETGALEDFQALNLARIRAGLLWSPWVLRQFVADNLLGFADAFIDKLQFNAIKLVPHSNPHLTLTSEDVDDLTERLIDLGESIIDHGYVMLIYHGRGTRLDPRTGNFQQIEAAIVPQGFIVPYTTLQPSNATYKYFDADADPLPTFKEHPTIDVEYRGRLLADEWMRGTDPRSLMERRYRYGAYPRKAIIIHAKDNLYMTSEFSIPYENWIPSYVSPLYEIETLEEARIDYLARLLGLPRQSNPRNPQPHYTLISPDMTRSNPFAFYSYSY